ncbi:glycosyltransferase family 4 protein [Gordonia sp. zg691]|uniref:Glycosyltransferase family 4 protein n=1 Tax=Gordonia jinghuaiqii TaxID=2758710 RepID=A0A7D7RP06_9ACTN|nr:glycosyltransferase family 4 protein [Gordonia jinghuaiqii]MBD0861066.1 glycosyltransferase family 4 protein [Gordonia jinghuaiqii]MCR5979774.1 glycosyltransferase [Gordonia jinghuaiqii]QMT00833.1 glycosyltransferase family 4 protein [Gordonia jinghuaiqii]
MRIALLSYRSKPHCGGQGVYVRHLSRELALLGHSVEIFSGQPYPELDQVTIDAGVTVTKVPSLGLYDEPDPFRTPRPGEYRDWIDLLEVGSMWTASFGEPLTFSLRVARLLKERRDDFDIVHDNQCLGYGLLDIQKAGFPLIATIHHPITRDRTLAVRAAKGWRKITAWRWHSFLRMQGRVSRRIPELLTVSRSSEVDIRKAFDIPSGRITTIPLGVDTEIFTPGVDRVPGRIVCVASADAPLKGVSYLLEAVAKLSAERNVELVLVSKLDPNGPSARMIEDLAISDRVSVVSGLEDSEIADLLASAEVACVPSLYEGFSLPAVEAMSCGTPLVATRAGAIPEVVGTDEEAAVLVPPRDSGRLAQAIGRLLDDADLRARLGAGGRRRAEENYSWAAVAAKTAAHYETVLAASRRATEGTSSADS